MTGEEWEGAKRIAELEGRLAMRNGLPASANPFQHDGRVEPGKGEFWRSWDSGWRQETWLTT